jgi:tyrosine-protein phosphatase SIW14
MLTGPKHRRVLIGIAVALVVTGGAIAAWEGWLEDRLIAKRWGEVVPGKIYRSGQVSAALIGTKLREHQIRDIVQLSGDDPADLDQAAEHKAARELGIAVHRCPLIGDGTGDPQNYVRALAAIAQAQDNGRAVLVHCHAGSQRTGGVVACYRMLFEGWSFDRALAEMEHYGWRPDRDAVLQKYLERHLPEIRARVAKLETVRLLPSRMSPVPHGSPGAAPAR